MSLDDLEKEWQIEPSATFGTKDRSQEATTKTHEDAKKSTVIE